MSEARASPLVDTGDAGRHLLRGVLRPPAATPHITQARRPARDGLG